MLDSLVTVAYLLAAVLFILSLSGLSRQETARRGNLYGIVGMTIAILATLASGSITGSGAGIILGALVAGGAIGTVAAKRVEMTSMPELVAILHSFVGAAAALVGISNHLAPVKVLTGTEATIHHIEIYVGVFIGAITFTGSVVAWGKLKGKIGSKPLLLPARHALNLVLLFACIALGGLYVADAGGHAVPWLLAMTAIACFIGWHLVMAIGGADMPVVVSMLNSYSGWAAAAAGFMLSNDALIVTGALVGSSGAILSYIMCKAMNRSFLSVIFGGFGANEGASSSSGSADAPQGEVTACDVRECVAMLEAAESVVIVPGYGMAVAQAQSPLWEVTRILQDRGCEVRFAIHPVAGRLPGHMNVLLAEANVPYDIVLEMDELNDDFPDTDVVLVVGANDIVNPSALTDPESPIAGMPVLEVWHSDKVVVFKRSMRSGYAGVGNPLFLHENTRMLFGDARDNVTALLAELK